MQNNRFLIFGRIGQVGWELRHKLACLGQVTAVDYPEIDFSKPDSIRAAVRAAQPAVVINAAAYTAVDKAESDPELAMAINGTGPGVIAEEAKRLGSLLVHYSTDYVFDGTKQGAYVETDAPNPVNVYGRTKLAGDEAIQAVGGDFLILRTSWVYGARGSNFLLTMLRLARERSELRIVDDQIGAPTSSECIAAGYRRYSGAVACACRRRTGWTQRHLQPDQHGRDFLVRICKGVVDPIGCDLRLYGSQPDSNPHQRLSTSRQASGQLASVVPTTGGDLRDQYAFLGRCTLPGAGDAC